MCRKLILLTAAIMSLGLVSSSYGAKVVIGDFEGGLDNWKEAWEDSPVLANATKGVTSGRGSLSLTTTGGYFCLQWNAPTVPASLANQKLTFDLTMIASEWPVGQWTKVADKVALNSNGTSGWKEYSGATVVDRLTGASASADWGRWWDGEPNALKTYTVDISNYDITGATWFQINISIQGGNGTGHFYFDNIQLGRPVATIPVDPNGNIAAANALAQTGDTIKIAAGTYYLTSKIEIKGGVTYQGAGPGLTIIDGNNVTRAFVAWGDRGATNGQVDANGVGVLNATGPKGWILEGMTIRNCVADANDRQDILSAARDLLTNYKATPYTLAAAQTENDGIMDNPGWFTILSGGADDSLTDVELRAYLGANPPGSAGHLVANGDKAGDGGAITIDNKAVGTIQNCEFLNNHTPAQGDGDDGGAVNITGLAVVTINNCLFDGNYACSPNSVTITGSDGDGGHIKIQGSSASALTPGTTLIANRCVFKNGNASDDGGAINSSAVGNVIRLDSCWFEGNTSWDNGNVCQFADKEQSEVTVTNCIFVKNITKADNSPDRMIETNRNSRFVNCTFAGNYQFDEDIIYNNADAADTNRDGVADETVDTTQVINCIFANNTFGADAGNDHILSSRNTSFSIKAVNCLFFNNLKADGTTAMAVTNRTETGSIMTNPLLDANYAPGAGSPAINAGVDPFTVGVIMTADYKGAPRPQGSAYDIGAYEFGVAAQ